MPNKHNASRRHHIPKMKFRVKNWAEYDAGLQRLGSLGLWVTPEVLDGRQGARQTTPGGQSSYSALVIETRAALTLSAVSRFLRNPSGSWENSAETRSMQQRLFRAHGRRQRDRPPPFVPAPGFLERFQDRYTLSALLRGRRSLGSRRLECIPFGYGNPETAIVYEHRAAADVLLCCLST